MRSISEMTNERGSVNYPTLQAEALHLDRKACLSGDDLAKMRRELHTVELTVESQASLLRYANKNLTRMERQREHYYDTESFEVEIGDVLLVFIRKVGD